MSASSVIAETMLAGDFNFGGLAGPAVMGNVVQKSIESLRGKKFPLTAYFDNQFVRELERKVFSKSCALMSHGDSRRVLSGKGGLP